MNVIKNAKKLRKEIEKLEKWSKIFFGSGILLGLASIILTIIYGSYFYLSCIIGFILFALAFRIAIKIDKKNQLLQIESAHIKATTKQNNFKTV